MKYLIETPHTPQECMRALDEEMAKGPRALRIFNYGCKSGDHTGYAIVDAKNAAEAQSLVPGFLLHKARIVEVAVLTPDQIVSLHFTKAA